MVLSTHVGANKYTNVVIYNTKQLLVLVSQVHCIVATSLYGQWFVVRLAFHFFSNKGEINCLAKRSLRIRVSAQWSHVYIQLHSGTCRCTVYLYPLSVALPYLYARWHRSANYNPVWILNRGSIWTNTGGTLDCIAFKPCYVGAICITTRHVHVCLKRISQV